MSDSHMDRVVPLPRLPPKSKTRPALGKSLSGSSTPMFHSANSSRVDIVHIHIDDHGSNIGDERNFDIRKETDHSVTSAKLSPPLSSASSASSVASSPTRSPSANSSTVDWNFPKSTSVSSSLLDPLSKRSSVQSSFIPLSPEIDPSGPVPKRPASSGVYTPASFPGPSGSASRLSSSSTDKIDPETTIRPPLSASGSSSFFTRSRSYLAYISPSSYMGSSLNGPFPAPSTVAPDLASAQPAPLGKGSVSSSGVYTPASFHGRQIRIASRNMTDSAMGSGPRGPTGFPLLSPRIVSAPRGSLSSSTSDSISVGLEGQTTPATIDQRARAGSVGSSLSVEEPQLRAKKNTSHIARKPLPAALQNSHNDEEESSIIPEPNPSFVQNKMSSSLAPPLASSGCSSLDHLGQDQTSEPKLIVESVTDNEVPPVVLSSQSDSLGEEIALLPKKEMRPMEVDQPTEEMVVGRVW